MVSEILAYKNSHRVEKKPIRTARTTPHTGAFNMNDRGSRNIPNFPSGFFHAPAPVNILAIEKIIFVEMPHFFGGLPPYHHACAAQGVHLGFVIRLQIGQMVLPENAAPRKN